MRFTILLTGAFLAIFQQILLAQADDWSARHPIPAPSGSFGVGTFSLRITDSSRSTSRHIPTRPLAIQVWYPAQPGTADRQVRYFTDAGLLDSMMQRQYLDLTPVDMQGWADVRLDARFKAMPAQPPTRSGWPVLMFSHGLGVARAHYSALSQELASHGYVVLTIDHPIGGFTLDPSGRVLTPGVDSLHYGTPNVLPFVVRDWATDAAFILRRMTANPQFLASEDISLVLDTARAGMLGHSIGGASALQACRSETLFTACADMDGLPFGDVEQGGVGRPFLVLLSEPDRGTRPPPRDSAEAVLREQFAQMGRERDSLFAAVSSNHPNVPSFVLKLRGTGHMSFSDAPFQIPSLLSGVGATLTPERMHQLISDHLLAFFDHYLRGRPLRLLRPSTSQGPG